jgi:hypothetical protein
MTDRQGTRQRARDRYANLLAIAEQTGSPPPWSQCFAGP